MIFLEIVGLYQFVTRVLYSVWCLYIYIYISFHIVSYGIIYHITFYHIIQYRIISDMYYVMWCCAVLCWTVVWCDAVSSRVGSCRVVPCRVISYHIIFYTTSNNIYTPVVGVNSPVENRSCPESTSCCRQCVIPLSWCQLVFDGWVMVEWLWRWLQQWAARGVFLRFWGPGFNTGIHLIKQLAHNWYLSCCQCTETCSRVSFIQNNIIKWTPSNKTIIRCIIYIIWTYLGFCYL